MIRRRIIFASSAVLAFVVLYSIGMLSPWRWGMYFNAWRAEAPVALYGVVTDEVGNPIGHAKHTFELSHFNWLYIVGGNAPKKRTTWSMWTDSRGCFEVRSVRGYSLYVKDIERPGFKFTPKVVGKLDNAFHFGGGGVTSAGPHRSDKSQPVKFRLQRVTK